ncbi:hypothetical protein TBK1r_51730 [Stieleria magnilauensis]|uniref:Uncharacterized protein n=2 Tax=Stieleria magnilauensis TaxID=2527963 RepID=A0ABX5XYZ7_9BACT|nr:hypothetical protein TBK1r_51730 [Planctomycetes bacterium TBK1r]
MSGFYSDLENQIGPPNAQIDKEWLSLLKKELERNGIEVLDSDKWKLYRSRENSVDFVHIVHVRGDEIVGLYEHRPSSEIIAD